MSFPPGGCNCGGTPCVQCLTLDDIFTVNGDTTVESPLWEITIPADTWRDGETIDIHYALHSVIGGTNNVPRTQFVPAVICGGAAQGISSNYFWGGQNATQLFRMTFRRIGDNVGIYDGDRAMYKVVSGPQPYFPDVIGFSSIFQAQRASGSNGPQDYQSATGAYTDAPDFTNDILLSLVVTPNGVSALDYIECLSPAVYKYNVK